MLCLTMSLADYLDALGWGSGADLAEEIGVTTYDVNRWKRRGAVIDSEGSVRSLKYRGWLYAYKVPSLIEKNYLLMEGL